MGDDLPLAIGFAKVEGKSGGQTDGFTILAEVECIEPGEGDGVRRKFLGMGFPEFHAKAFVFEEGNEILFDFIPVMGHFVKGGQEDGVISV